MPISAAAVNSPLRKRVTYGLVIDGAKLRAHDKTLTTWDAFPVAKSSFAEQIGGHPMKTRLFTSLVLALVALPVAAQDVIVGDPVWALPDAPDEMPKFKSRLRPEFPEELKKVDELGYVIITRALDDKGKSLLLNATGTHTPYKREVEEAFKGGWTMTPAKDGGKAINARVWVSVIFNPKSAATKGPDATPRLLAVTPVFTSERPTSSGIPMVRMKVSLDAAGAVTAVAPEGELKPKLADAVTSAVKAWQFAPARKGGQAVASEIVVPVLCQPPISANAAKNIPPKAISRDQPEYPREMRRYGLTGQVVLEFEVGVDGKVLNPVVAESDNPAFDEPALKSLLKWKFEPATSDGKPVKTKMKVPVVFTLNRPAGESGILNFDGKVDQSKLPPELRYDVPPKIRGVLLPVYPIEAREARASGKASVVMLINPQGRVSQVQLLSADRPEFGLALSAAAEGFRFDPAYRQGKPVPHMFRFEHEFNYANLSDDDDSLLSMEKKHPERIVSADKLDAEPTPLSRRSPVFPVQVPPEVTKGEAVIQFLIDKEGRARIPRVVSATDPAFGYAGIQAVGTWLFTPPLSGGKPVVTRVQIPLRFSTKAEKPPQKPAVTAPAPAASAPAP
jgi:TonB family protein